MHMGIHLLAAYLQLQVVLVYRSMRFDNRLLQKEMILYKRRFKQAKGTMDNFKKQQCDRVAKQRSAQSDQTKETVPDR
jgi:hypothetical protein